MSEDEHEGSAGDGFYGCALVLGILALLYAFWKAEWPLPLGFWALVAFGALCAAIGVLQDFYSASDKEQESPKRRHRHRADTE